MLVSLAAGWSEMGSIKMSSSSHWQVEPSLGWAKPGSVPGKGVRAQVFPADCIGVWKDFGWCFWTWISSFFCGKMESHSCRNSCGSVHTHSLKPKEAIGWEGWIGPNPWARASTWLQTMHEPSHPTACSAAHGPPQEINSSLAILTLMDTLPQDSVAKCKGSDQREEGCDTALKSLWRLVLCRKATVMRPSAGPQMNSSCFGFKLAIVMKSGTHLSMYY